MKLTQEFGEGAKSNLQIIFKYNILMNSKFNINKLKYDIIDTESSKY